MYTPVVKKTSVHFLVLKKSFTLICILCIYSCFAFFVLFDTFLNDASMKLASFCLKGFYVQRTVGVPALSYTFYFVINQTHEKLNNFLLWSLRSCVIGRKIFFSVTFVASKMKVATYKSSNDLQEHCTHENKIHVYEIVWKMTFSVCFSHTDKKLKS